MTAEGNNTYLEEVQRRIIVFDGAMGTGLQQQELTDRHFGGSAYAGCYDYLCVTWPGAVEKIHRGFLDVGVDVIETNTFRANAVTLQEFGLSDRVFEINRAAAELASGIASSYSTPEHRRFVAGSMGPTGFLPSSADGSLNTLDFDALAAVFAEQAAGLIAGGAEVLLLETSQDILEVKAAVAGCRRAFREGGKRLPVQAQVTLDTNGRMLLGTDIQAVLAILEGLDVDIIGMNCSTGPEHMRTPAAYLCKHSTKPVSTIPNAGMPVNRGGKAFYPLQPEEYADAMEDFAKNLGVNILGGCCGTTPEHLAALVSRVRGVVPRPRKGKQEDCLASGISAVRMKQEPAPLIIGERCNPQGSSVFKKILLAEDWSAASETAREQVEQGAHALDVAAALSENRDEKERMIHLVRRFTGDGIDAPLVIDTTEADVMEAALKTAPGRCLLNSTHLESGPEKAEGVFTLAKEHNAAVMMLTIDEEGMAKTVDRKLEIARRLYAMAVDKHGLAPGSLVFDLLTFSLATGEADYIDSARATIEGIRRIKEELPGVYTSLGVSNVSFGFGKHARRVLNSVFLYHTVQAGLDMAIVHAAKILPYPDIPEDERKAAEDLIFNTDNEALNRFIALFEGRAEEPEDTGTSEETGDPANLLGEGVLKRRKQGLEGLVTAIIGGRSGAEASEEALRTINTVLLPAMKEVGDRFGRGEIILPFVLQSAEVMKEAVGLLEGYLERGSGPTRGTVVLATVAGDVHDIGKNLVKTILANNGYTVVDLGKQVPVETIVEEAEKQKADAVGLSALLVSTSLQMGLAVKELAARGLKIPLLIGGAAINRAFADEISVLEDGSRYAGGVYYCKDAFDGLSRLETAGREPDGDPPVQPRSKPPAQPASPDAPPRPDLTSRPVPQPPFTGPRLLEIPLDEIVRRLDTKQLFMLNWGAGKLATEKRPGVLKDFEGILDRVIEETRSGDHITPRGLYGFFPVRSDGEYLLVLDPDDPTSGRAVERFHFPPEKRRLLSAAAGFKNADEGGYDITLFQVVTCGAGATRRFDALQNEDRYTEAFYFHGFAVQAAEAAAEYVFEKGIRELGVPPEGIRRISWGYPAAPEVSEHEKLFRLLPAAEKLDMHLTSAYQLVPEQSTAAIMVYKV